MKATITAKGHPNVSATHKNTIEITREDFLTPRGDCIIGIGADKACSDLSKKFLLPLRKGKKIRIALECNGKKDVVTARGSPLLELTDNKSLVIRKSSFTCPRTLCIHADKAAADLDRKLLEELKKGGRLKTTLEII
jgi:hypothetical protein